MQSLNKKTLALALVLGLSASSASAAGCFDSLKAIPCDYFANFKAVFTGRDAKDADTSRLTAASKSILPTVVIGALGYVVYIKYQEYKKNQANKAASK